MDKSIPEGIKRRLILILLSGEDFSKAPRGIEAFDPYTPQTNITSLAPDKGVVEEESKLIYITG